MSETKHAATPWRKKKRQPHECIEIGPFGCPSVCYFTETVSKKMDEANADFILRAANSHDGLLAALKKIRRYERSGGDSPFDGTHVLDLADAAIAAAEVE